MQTVSGKTQAEFKRKNLENSVVYDHNDPRSNLIFLNSEQLTKYRKDWFPLCAKKDEKTGEIIYGGRPKVYHTYTQGATGCGKTTRITMQSIRALSMMPSKPSFIVSDISGEIVENIYDHLKQNGYDIKILNCDFPEKSDSYNPFFEIADDCIANGKITNEALLKLRNIASIIFPIENEHDPIWDIGSKTFAYGLFLDKFEDLMKFNCLKKNISFYSIIKTNYWIRDSIRKPNGDGIGRFSSSDTFNLMRIKHFAEKEKDALSVEKIVGVTDNAERTRASYLGVVEQRFDTFGQPTLYKVTTDNTINVKSVTENPTAVFVRSATSETGDHLIAMLLANVYDEYLRNGPTKKHKRNKRDMHCFLDEFSNIYVGKGNEFVKMLTTSRKYGMFWHMLLQCDAQLDEKFGGNFATSIRANSTEIFMGSQVYSDLERFSKSCGKKSNETLGSSVRFGMPEYFTNPSVAASDLFFMDEGCAYVRQERQPLLKTYYEAFYNCSEFECKTKPEKIYPKNNFDYEKTYMPISEIPQVLSKTQSAVMADILDGVSEIEVLFKTYPFVNMTKILAQLICFRLIEKIGMNVIPITDENQECVLRLRREHGIFDEKSEEFNLPNEFEVESKSEEDESEEDESEEDYKTEYKILLEMQKLVDEDYEAAYEECQRLEKIACVPCILTVTLDMLTSGHFDDRIADRFVETYSNFTDLIYRNFIVSFDFDEEAEWINEYKAELRIVKSMHFLPVEIKHEFERVSYQKKFIADIVNAEKRRIANKI